MCLYVCMSITLRDECVIVCFKTTSLKAIVSRCLCESPHLVLCVEAVQNVLPG